MGDLAKIIRTGRSQQVELPEQFRFEGSEVSIRREGQKVILEPLVDATGWLDEIAGNWDADAAAAALDRPGPDSYERPDIQLDD